MAWPSLTGPTTVPGALEELRFHATVICSIRVSIAWGPFGASWEARGDVATSSLSAERLKVVYLYHEPVPASRGCGGSASKVPYEILVVWGLPQGGRG